MNRVYILEITEIHEDIDVYDIEVEEDHSFIAEDLIVHNCLRCAALDGKVYKYIDGTDHNGPVLPLHPNCRCTYVPIVKSWKELGIDAAEFPPTTRAAFDGQVPDTMNYQQWLKMQDEGFQHDVLGENRFQLWNQGKLTFKQMVTDKKILTLDELKKKME